MMMKPVCGNTSALSIDNHVAKNAYDRLEAVADLLSVMRMASENIVQTCDNEDVCVYHVAALLTQIHATCEELERATKTFERCGLPR